MRGEGEGGGGVCGGVRFVLRGGVEGELGRVMGRDLLQYCCCW